MAVPDFQSLMLPTLEVLADGQPRPVSHLREALAQRLSLSEADRSEPLPSGRQSRFDNRVAWTMVHLAFAQLISRPERGVVKITERGIKLFASKPERVDLRTLRQYPEYDLARRPQRGGDDDSENVASAIASPEEILEKSISDLRTALAVDLLERIKAKPPTFFERLVLDLMQSLGYGNRLLDWGEQLGGSGDRGLDGVIKEDRLGLDVIYLQAKRWDSPVGPSIVREFLGALDQAGAKKGVLITTSTFTKEARLPTNRSDKKISLIDGLTLAELMIEHDVGITTARTFYLKKIDLDYFEEP